MKQQFICERRPKADPRNIVLGKNYRITFLTDRLVRFEYNESGAFVDEASQVIWYRDLEEVPFEIKQKNNFLEIQTKSIRIRYDERAFDESILSVKLKKPDNGCDLEWYYGRKEDRNLFGTARTLDEADGRIRLEKGILSRDGFAVLDDSKTILLTEDGWIKERKQGGEDFYLFAYGHDYRGAVKDFFRVTGRVPMLPKYALGNWWSRYYEYSQDEYQRLMDRFLAEKIPFSVAVIDMDWHITDIDKKYGSGWTGYTWNRDLFPDPGSFMDNLHDRGMKVTLNVHPALGIRECESMYKEMAEAMGMDPAAGEPVEFDITDPEFLENYFEIVHHPLEEEGVDFWWLDWQQGMFDPKMKNLSNTWWINYAFFSDMEKRRETRPMLYHRWGGLGNHRYQVGFSGDAVISWKSLDFQPYFNSTASNVLYGYWSHDLGGHIGSQIDPEMYTRWLQFGALSPIMRTHSQKGAKLNKEPWVFNKEYCDIIRETIRQRYVMAPYIYTMARKGYDDGISLCRPMYYDYPENKEAYEFRNEYMFGDDVLVMPVTAPVENDYAQVRVWLPEGEWYEWHTGALLKGNQIVERSFAVDEYPIYIKAGAILPMYLDNVMNLNGNDEEVAVTFFPGGGDTAEFKLYEDNGNDKNYASEYAVTKLSSVRNGNEQTLVIGKREGAYKDMPLARPFKVKVLSSLIPQSVTVNGHPAKYHYSGEDFALLIDVPAQACDQEKVVKIVYPSEKVDLNGLLGASRRIAKSMEQLKYRNSYIVFKEEFGKMGSLSEAVTYAPSEMPALIADFWKSYNELPAVLERQGMKSDLATWFLQSVCWSKR